MAVRPRVKLFTLLAMLVSVAGTIHAQPTFAATTSATTRIVELVNAQRLNIRGASCPALVVNPALANAAQHHANDMARNNYFSHTGRDGRSAWQRINNAGYQPRRTAENIAAGGQTAEATIAQWMRSPSHRANILNCRLHEIGVGVASEQSSRYKTYWVQDFGTAR